jgi:hypothetical protein
MKNSWAQFLQWEEGKLVLIAPFIPVCQLACEEVALVGSGLLLPSFFLYQRFPKGYPIGFLGRTILYCAEVCRGRSRFWITIAWEIGVGAVLLTLGFVHVLVFPSISVQDPALYLLVISSLICDGSSVFPYFSWP